MTKLSEYEIKSGHKESDYCTCDRAGTCNGCNLFICKTCNGAESGLTTNCVGRPITPSEGEEIDKGILDYKDGKWIQTVRSECKNCCLLNTFCIGEAQYTKKELPCQVLGPKKE